MPTIPERDVRGRLIPETGVIEHKIASVAARALRFAFIVHSAAEPEEMRRYMSYNASLWGGRYNNFIPADGGRTISEAWWRVLAHHDPDYVVLCDDIDTALVEEVHTRIQPYYLDCTLVTGQ